MNKVNARVFWLFFVLGMIFVTALVTRSLQLTDDIRLGLLIWQQLLFIVGGVLGSRQETLRIPPLKTLAWGLLGGVGLYIANLIVGAVSTRIAVGIFGPEVVQNLILEDMAAAQLLLTSKKPLIVFGMMLLVTIGAPLGEELFFRGLLLDLCKQHLGTFGSVFVAALFFAVMHFYVLQFLPVFVSGIVLGLLFVHFDNIYIPIVAHSVVNGLVLLVWIMGL